MSNHNYSQYSNNKKKKNSDSRNAGTAAQAAYNKPKMEEAINQFAVVEEVTAEPAEVKMVVETVETVSLPKTVTGTVANCSKLNVREKPATDADVLVVLNADSEVEIDPARSTVSWLKITTAAGVEGYCMRKFVNAKL